MDAAFTQVILGLETGELSTPSGVPLPAEARAALLGLGVASTPAQAAPPVALPAQRATARQLAVSLAPANNAGAARAAATLVDNLGWLMTTPDALHDVVVSFNTFVDASSDAFLMDPSPEFRAIQATLGPLVEAAMDTQE